MNQSPLTDRVLRVGVIGTGHYGTAIVTQAAGIPNLDVAVVADASLEAARQAFHEAGIPDDAIQVAESRKQALQALEHNRRVVCQDALLMVDLPLQVVVESTGHAEAGARHAFEAIHHGKHVVMVTKETDVVVGPILNDLASQNGVVYATADGDQPGLLMGLVDWCRTVGLDVFCAGKYWERPLVWQPDQGCLLVGGRRIDLSAEDCSAVEFHDGEGVRSVLARRQAVLGSLAQIANFERIELTVVANGTGLQPDTPMLHAPVLWPREIPQVLCPEIEGGILQSHGAVDIVSYLRLPQDVGMAGGVFVVVGCATSYSRNILKSKRHVANARGTAFLLYRPHHLCGVETPWSILQAGLAHRSTSGGQRQQRFDVVGNVQRELKAGEALATHESDDFQTLIQPATPIQDVNPIPLIMAEGLTLARDVPTGAVLTRAMVQPPPDSFLWKLRAQQDTASDETFAPKGSSR